jgi:two-component system sensor histidine kinase QseC
VRNDLIGKVSSDLFILFIILIPVLAITMWIAISNGLSPLHNLASQLGRRSAEKLDAVSDTDVPSEIQTIAGAINQLLAGLKDALAREKRITSDAAHELRTPLAAVKLHAELASKATNKEDRIISIDHVLAGIDRTTHLVDQLLALARLEPDTFNQQLKTHNLKQLVIEEAAMLAPLAHNKNIELSVHADQDVYLRVDNTSFRLLLSNLLNNAISYTQQGGTIDISLSGNARTVSLVVEDNGPGIPADEHKRVLERFYRAQNHDQPGCGIGLSIVMRIVELHHATLSMDTPASGSGLGVTVDFPVSGNEHG